MQLIFPKRQTGNVYCLSKNGLIEAISKSFLYLPIQFNGKTEIEQAINCVYEAFRLGMERGLADYRDDSCRTEMNGFMAEARPQSGTFELYRKLS